MNQYEVAISKLGKAYMTHQISHDTLIKAVFYCTAQMEKPVKDLTGYALNVNRQEAA